MMTCREIEDNLPAYLEDLLAPEEKARVREHLVSCRRCSKSLADLKRMDTLLSGLEEVTPPPWFQQRIMARVREETQPEMGFFRRLFSPLRLKIPLSTAALLVLSVLAFYVYRGQEPQLRKEGLDLVLPPPVSQPRLEKGEPPRPAPTGKVSSPAASSPAPASKAASLPAKSTSAVSSPKASFRTDLPREMPSPPTTERQRMQPDLPQPGNQPLPAFRKDLPRELEGGAEKEKGKMTIGPGDSAGRQGGHAGEALLAAQESDRTATARTMDRAERKAGPLAAGRREIEKGESAPHLAQAPEGERPAAVAEILSLLRQYGALKIDRRTSGEGEIVTAALPSRQVRPLLQALEKQGVAGRKVSIGTVHDARGTVEIRIELPGGP